MDLSQAPPQAQVSQPSPYGDALGKIGSFFAHPLVQSALASYFGFISSPRRMGLGTAIGQGGLAGLGQYGQAQIAQTEAQRGQLEALKTQEEIRKDKAREAAIQGLPADIRNYAEVDPSFVGEMGKQQIITKANKSALDGLAVAYQNDPQASALIGAYYQSPASIDLGKVVETIQKVKTGGLTIQKAIADINKASVETQKAQGDIALQPLTAKEKLANISQKGAETEKDVAEAAKARSGVGTEGMESKTIRKIGDPNQTQEISYKKGGTYTPPSGWEIVTGGEVVAPKDPTAEIGKGLENLSKADALRKSEESLYGKAKGWVAGDKAAQFHNAMSRGLSPKTGRALPPLPPGARWSDPLDDGTPTAIHADGKRYPLME